MVITIDIVAITFRCKNFKIYLDGFSLIIVAASKHSHQKSCRLRNKKSCTTAYPKNSTEKMGFNNRMSKIWNRVTKIPPQKLTFIVIRRHNLLITRMLAKTKTVKRIVLSRNHQNRNTEQKRLYSGKDRSSSAI